MVSGMLGMSRVAALGARHRLNSTTLARNSLGVMAISHHALNFNRLELRHKIRALVRGTFGSSSDRTLARHTFGSSSGHTLTRTFHRRRSRKLASAFRHNSGHTLGSTFHRRSSRTLGSTLHHGSNCTLGSAFAGRSSRALSGPFT